MFASISFLLVDEEAFFDEVAAGEVEPGVEAVDLVVKPFLTAAVGSFEVVLVHDSGAVELHAEMSRDGLTTVGVGEDLLHASGLEGCVIELSVAKIIDFVSVVEVNHLWVFLVDVGVLDDVAEDEDAILLEKASQASHKLARICRVHEGVIAEDKVEGVLLVSEVVEIFVEDLEHLGWNAFLLCSLDVHFVLLIADVERCQLLESVDVHQILGQESGEAAAA